ncbi:hypothetical protein AAHH80_39850, partial [Burkholderia pseudomallei]
WNQALPPAPDPGDATTAAAANANGIACALRARVHAQAGIDQQPLLDPNKGTRAVMLDPDPATLAHIRVPSLAGGQAV